MDIRTGQHGLDLSPLDLAPYAQSADDQLSDGISPFLATVVDQLALGIAVIATDSTVMHANPPLAA